MQGETIGGRYRLVGRIGVGAMSEVWEAEDPELGRTVAVKLMRSDADTGRFEREARAVAALSHPNIIRIFDHGEADGRRYLVLEYLPGGSLHRRLRPGEPLPDAEARRVATDMAAGLAHAHAQEVVHRDLKPANVLFDGEGRAKLADFGIARLEGAGTITDAGTVLGTAAYISPEQASGLPATAASDVYSFGVILFRLLTGRLPFEASDPVGLAMQHVSEPAPSVRAVRPDAPARLAALVDASLAKDPEGRPPHGAALLRGLEPGEPAALETSVTRRMTPVPPLRPPRRSRGRVALAAAGLVLLAAAGVAAAVLATRSDPPASPTRPAARTTRTRATTSVRGSTAPETSTARTESTATHGGATTSTATTTAPPATTAPTTTATPTTAPTTTPSTAPATTGGAAPGTTAPAPGG